MATITAWSYSRWNTYQQCPRKAKYLYVEKMKEPSSPALERGSKIHKDIEKYLREGGRQPKVLAAMKEQYTDIRKIKPLVEFELALTANWDQTDWFSKDAWCRIKIDALVSPEKQGGNARVIDHKSGRIAEGKYDDQLELYGLAGLIIFPQALSASGELWFLEHNRILPEIPVTYQQAELKTLKKKWIANTKRMLTDTRFEPKPGSYCRWCHFRKDNGGPCDL